MQRVDTGSWRGFITANGAVLLISAIVLFSFFVRLHALDSQSLECEELYTIPAATGHQYVYLQSDQNLNQASFPVTRQQHRDLLSFDGTRGLSDVTAVLKRNVHMPLYFYFMHYWIQWFGTSEWVLRLPSLLCGTAAVLLVFLLATELFKVSVGLVSASLLGLMPEQIHYSQQARMYPLLLLLVVASSYAVILARKPSKSPGPYILFSLTSIAGLYTHYLYLFCFLFHLLYIWVISRLGRREKRLWLTSNIVIVAALAPWLFVSLTQKRTSAEVVNWVRGTPSFELITTAVGSKLTRLISLPDVKWGWVSALLAYWLLVLGVRTTWSKRSTFLFLFAWAILPIAGILLMDTLLDTTAINIMRYWIVISPALYLLISAGLMSIRNRSIRVALIISIAVFLVPASIWTAQGKIRGKPDRHRDLAHFIDQRIDESGPAVVITEGVNSIPLALGYYGSREMKILRFNWLMDQLQNENFQSVLEGRRNVWLLVSGNSVATRFLEQNGLVRRGPPVLFGHIWVFEYVVQTKEPVSAL